MASSRDATPEYQRWFNCVNGGVTVKDKIEIEGGDSRPSRDVAGIFTKVGKRRYISV